MNTRQHPLQPTALAIAVAAAIGAMAHAPSAWADDDEAAALKLPTSTVEIGVIGVSKDEGTTNMGKFGEYNGLYRPGGAAFLNANIRGGNAYQDNEGGGLRRWSVRATDLGLSSSNLGAGISEQGQWSLGFEHDRLRHSLADGYQTPYTLSGNNYTLPSAFTVVSTAGLGTNALSAAQLSSYQLVNLASSRHNTSVNGSVYIDARTSLNFDFKHLEQSGAKLMGFGVAGVNKATGEAVAILPMPTQSSTDSINLGVQWNGDGAHLSAAYFGSFFRNDQDRVNFQSYAGAINPQWMSTAPDNSFNQLSLSGGYRLAPRTRMTGNLSYGLNTQNAAFVTPEAGMMVQAAPVGSLSGKVVNTHADVKVTDQTTSRLTLSGSLKYDERDNQTPSNLYNFNAISGQHTAYYPNTPLSTRKVQAEFASDYRIASGHAIRAAYTHEELDRWCNSFAVGATYPAGSNCVVAQASRDDRLDATYRMKATDDMDWRLGYGYSDRRTSSDPLALATFISRNGAVPGPVPATGNTTPMGQNAGDYYGYYPFFSASRTQQSVKGGVNWQATEVLSLGLNARYSNDQYGSSYGVQNGHSNSLNVDATYALSETGSVYAWASQQHRQRELTSLTRYSTTAAAATATAVAVPATASWTNTLKDSDSTFGLGLKQEGLMGGKLDVSGDWAYSSGKSTYATALNYATTTTGGLTCADATLLTCGQLPDIRSTLNQFKLTGTYRVNKGTQVVLRALRQRLSSSDYYYNGLAYGYTASSLLATNQVAPNYTVNALSASLLFSY
jgi:MtrB/PioB family decaheme-associated outer membrane protein